MITILGPTACGKTRLAVDVALHLGGEIISADSRQVFRGMDIGTGKDLTDYNVGGVEVPYHLIDIREPGYEYSVFEFQTDFVRAYNDIVDRNKLPILCGGTGLYIEAVLRNYRLADVPQNNELRLELEQCSDEDLVERLKKYISLHNHTDTETRERLIRAIEIQEYQAQNPNSHVEIPDINHLVLGVAFPRDLVMQRIENRLQERLQNGMIDEIDLLLKQGVEPERLIRYGLEYKYITLYLQNDISYSEMFEKLNIAIRQFAKRQMTWYRRMERNGVDIHWIDGTLSDKEKLDEVCRLYEGFAVSNKDK
ncbi:MAG: tRNA (adenosine(37)-N6)-dimethylallyltransferase MiaA [Bacteroidales bacterium]|nr:tRNA (adenosine(37)-N6)-dimethylallyltransferase MiaA [Bacteroidales bacterium]